MSKKEYKSTDAYGYTTTTSLNRYDFNSVLVMVVTRNPDGAQVGTSRSSLVSMDWLREAVGEI